MKADSKNKRGDTKSGYLVRDVDAMHLIMPLFMGSRTDNEAVSEFEIDAEPLDEYLKAKNSSIAEGIPRYTYLHVIAAALCRVVQQRPLMNRYIKRMRYFDRKDISVSFIAKKQKKDGSEEALVVAKYDTESERRSIDIIHDKICRQVNELRHENKASSTDNLTYILKKLPRPVIRLVVAVLVKLDSYDRLPDDITNSLPYNSTCFISNLGSIKLDAKYHHLINFGSNSFFLLIGTKKKVPQFNDDGTFTLKEIIPVSVTIDERIADGVYFGNSLKMLCSLLKYPYLLDRSANDVFDIKQYSED